MTELTISYRTRAFLFRHQVNTYTQRATNAIWTLISGVPKVKWRPQKLEVKRTVQGRYEERGKKEGGCRAVTFHRCLLGLAAPALRTKPLVSWCTADPNPAEKSHPSISGHCALLDCAVTSGLSCTLKSAICSSLLCSGACKHVLTSHVLLHWHGVLARAQFLAQHYLTMFMELELTKNNQPPHEQRWPILIMDRDLPRNNN